jgi:hypothetical protein
VTRQGRSQNCRVGDVFGAANVVSVVVKTVVSERGTYRYGGVGVSAVSTLGMYRCDKQLGSQLDVVQRDRLTFRDASDAA